MNFALKKPMEPNGPQNYSSVEAYFAIGKSPILLYCLDHQSLGFVEALVVSIQNFQSHGFARDTQCSFS
jgi:hypothetical protein